MELFLKLYEICFQYFTNKFLNKEIKALEHIFFQIEYVYYTFCIKNVRTMYIFLLNY